MQFPNQLAALTQKLARIPQQQLAKGLVVVLLCYIAYLLAQLTWLLLANQSSDAAVITSDSQRGQVTSSKKIDLSKVSALNLFGLYTNEPSEQKVVEVQDAPETKLNLKLSGVVASDDSRISAAIIENNNKQETYGIGDTINGTRAVLDNVFNDRVLIKQSGRLETLMLDGFDYQKQQTHVQPKRETASNQRKTKRTQFTSSPSILDLRDNKNASRNAQELKAAIANEPGKITDYLRISPKREQGRIVGYVLMPGKNPDFFKSAGLKSGDVAVQMNGYDLSVPQDAAQALQALKVEKEVSLLLDRKGDMTEILFSIHE